MFGLETHLAIILITCLLAAVVFEFINGFHDTANAVATVIYTNSLKPEFAVVWSGIWNAIGVFAGGIAVAMGITHLLPLELLLNADIYQNIALISALLLTAIIWNFATWMAGIPSSSSHTLIGSILGVGMAYTLFVDQSAQTFINWAKTKEIGLSLLLSPLLGFSLAILLMFIMRQSIKAKFIFKSPNSNNPPPFWIRLILLLTCTGVSFSHGSNDGQKGVGLVMLILISIVPGYFTLDLDRKPTELKEHITHFNTIVSKIDTTELLDTEQLELNKIKSELAQFEMNIQSIQTFDQMTNAQKFEVRSDLVKIGQGVQTLVKSKNLNLSISQKEELLKHTTKIKSITEYAPNWVILMVSLSLGFGTLVGWKRIVTTIGEKIGKQHLSYAQGASAELVAASTIGFSTWLGLPVSTTHVLSSGIAGSMVASKGVKNLQPKTIKMIALAWVLTLPVSIVLSGLLFLLFRAII